MKNSEAIKKAIQDKNEIILRKIIKAFKKNSTTTTSEVFITNEKKKEIAKVRK